MGRLKRGEKKKIPISFRLKSETIDRLKKFDKFHSKVDEFINDGINEYGKRYNLIKLQKYYEDKKWEYDNIDIEHNNTNKGILKGLEIALQIMNK